jgi:hypothetical protein
MEPPPPSRGQAPRAPPAHRGTGAPGPDPAPAAAPQQPDLGSASESDRLTRTASWEADPSPQVRGRRRRRATPPVGPRGRLAATESGPPGPRIDRRRSAAAPARQVPTTTGPGTLRPGSASRGLPAGTQEGPSARPASLLSRPPYDDAPEPARRTGSPAPAGPAGPPAGLETPQRANRPAAPSSGAGGWTRRADSEADATAPLRPREETGPESEGSTRTASGEAELRPRGEIHSRRRTDPADRQPPYHALASGGRDDRLCRALALLPHRAQDWREAFRHAGDGTSAPYMPGIRQLRVLIWLQTVRLTSERAFQTRETRWLSSAPATQTVRLSGRQPTGGNTDTEVRSQDFLDAARELHGQGLRVAVLNMANARRPGGGGHLWSRRPGREPPPP